MLSGNPVGHYKFTDIVPVIIERADLTTIFETKKLKVILNPVVLFVLHFKTIFLNEFLEYFLSQ